MCDDTESGIAEALRHWRSLGREELENLKRRQLATWKECFSREIVGTQLESTLLKLARTTA